MVTHEVHVAICPGCGDYEPLTAPDYEGGQPGSSVSRTTRKVLQVFGYRDCLHHGWVWVGRHGGVVCPLCRMAGRNVPTRPRI